MKYHFLTVPPVGTAMLLDAQRYTLIAVEDYTRRDGAMSNLLVWSADCPTCGVPFEVRTGLKGKDITRRCPEHRAPLTPVGKRVRGPGNGVHVQVIPA